MAAYFGTTIFTDAWLMASVVPNLLFSTINGTISTTIIPLMTQGDTEYSSRSVQRFIDETFTAIIVISLFLIVIGEIFAHPIIDLVAPGFHGRELALTVEMTRIMIPTILFWALAGLVTGVLQEREEYFFPALSPVAVNIIRITSIIILGNVFGIEGVAVGFTLAVFSQLLVTVPVLHRHGIRLRMRWKWTHPLLKRMVRMSIPFFVTSSVGTVAIIVDRILASELVHGSLASLNYSYVLVQIPIGLIISSLATPIYTRLSQHHSAHDPETYRRLAMKGFRLVIMVIVPITVWFIILRIPIIRIMYQRGAFTNHSTMITASTLLDFAIGLPGFALAFYMQKLFFSTQDSISPARYSVITIVLNIIGDIILVRFMQADGLALATALGGWINATLLIRRGLEPHKNPDLQFRKTIIKLSVAGFVMAAFLAFFRRLIELNNIQNIFGLALGLAAAVSLSGLVFAAILFLLRYPELEALRARIFKKPRRGSSPS